MICWIGLPDLLCSWTTSSTWRSSSFPCSRRMLMRGCIVSTILCGSCLRCLELLELGENAGWVLSFGDDFVLGNHAGLVFLEQEAVERQHAVFRTSLNVGIDTERLVIADERADRWGIDHDFEDGDAARFIRTGQEQLRDNRLQNGRELNADLFLLVGWESVHNTVNGFRRA